MAAHRRHAHRNSRPLRERVIRYVGFTERHWNGTRTAEEWISLVRVLVLLTLIPASWFGLIAVPRPAADAVMILLGGYVILLAIGARRLPFLWKVDLIIVLDLLVVTLVVLVSGSVNSPFLYLYYMIILEAAARFNLRQALAAALAMAAVVVMLWIRGGHPEAFETTGFRLGAFVASGFFLALLLGVLVQEYRSSQDRVEELLFDNDLASRLSGELRVQGVAELLLQVFLEITQLPKGAAFLPAGQDDLYLAAAQGFIWEAKDPSPALLKMPRVPGGARGGEIMILPAPTHHHRPDGVMVCVPLVRHDELQMWLCGLGAPALAQSDVMQRRLRRMAVQGSSALEAARLHEKVRELAATDALTGVANRRSFFDRIIAELARSHRSGRALSVALLDLNGFKDINDNYGHGVGDAALVCVAQAISRGMRGSDLLARLGGDEFAVLLPESSAGEAVKVLARLCAAQIAVPDGRGGDLHLHLSWGVATWPHDGATPEQLLQVADHHLYAMKRRMRGET
jgi:diguanylate cyclase (GGDEF)-like protein